MSFALMTMLALQAWAQDRQVTGKVTAGEDGSPLPGVNVAVKGTTRGTTTNAEGEYRLGVGNGSMLVFSAIGYKRQEVAVGGQSRVDVTLTAETSQLEEVVVTALGVQRQRDQLGYNAEAIKADKINQARGVGLANALAGKVAGLQINTTGNGVNPSTRIQLRGNRSLTGNNQALIVIDGVQVPQDAINYLNPNDVDNITVLKGANAAALYGSDASNGALVITTKRGASGAPRVNFSNTSFLESINFMPKFNERFGAGTEQYSRVYVPIENQQYGPAYTSSGNVLVLDPDHGDEIEQPASAVQLGRELEGGTKFTAPYQNSPNSKLRAFDIGNTIQNDLNLSAGDERSRIFISVQDVNTKGIQPGDKYRRTGARLNADRTYGKFKAGFGVDYRVGRSDNTWSNFYYSVINTASNINLDNYRNWEPFRLEDGSLNPANPNNYFNDYYNNPYFDAANQRQTTINRYFQGNLTLELQATSWLNFLYRIGATNQQFESKYYTSKYTYSAYAKASGKYNARDIAGGVTDYSGNTARINQDFFATITNKIGPVSSRLIVGTNVREDRRKYLEASASALVVPGLYNVSNRVGEPVVSQTDRLVRNVGVYADWELGFRDYLFLHLSGRNDWTSLLAKGNNSYFYPGADVSFVLTKAIPAMRDLTWLSSARLRAAATQVGNVNIGPYQLATPFSQNFGFPYGSLPGFTIGNRFNNPNIQPEFINSMEVGGEFAFLNDRLTLDLSYYAQESRNQTVPIDVSRTTGYSSATVNAGVMQNNGFEIDVKTTPVRLTNGLRWDVGVNYSLTDTKVKTVYEDLNEINLSSFYGAVNSSLYQVFAVRGQQYPALKVVDYLRAGYDANGNVTDDRVVVDPVTGYPQKAGNLRFIGQTNPRHRLGINTSVAYKGFRLAGTAEYRGGHYIAHGLAESMWFTGSAWATTVYGRERFVFPNSVIKNADGSVTPNTNITVRDGGLGTWDSQLRNYGTNFVTSAAFWKLRELALTYDLPTALLARTRVLKSVQVGLIGRNLLTLLPKENVYTDPEFNNTTENAIGVNATYITPPTRSYGFTVNVGF
jgi:TonB-linked SusC/RagA family outer membrane protein